jgi:tetratricopeptide (TPR) repeat protein
LFLKVKVVGALRGSRENKIKIRDECIDIFKQSPHTTNLNRVISLLYKQRANASDNYENAISDYECAMKLDHTISMVSFHQFKADCLHDFNRYEESILELGECIKLEPTNAFYYMEKGTAYLNMNRFEESIAELNQAISLSPKNAKSLCHRASAFHKLHRIEEAFTDVNKAIEIDSNLCLAYLLKARCFVDIDRYSDAIQCCDKAIQLKEKAHTYNSIAYVYRSMKKLDEALANVEQALELEPTTAYIIHTKAELLYDLGRYDESIEYCNTSIILDKYCSDAYHHRSLCYMAKNQIQEALVDAQNAVLFEKTKVEFKNHLDLVLARVNSETVDINSNAVN